MKSPSRYFRAAATAFLVVAISLLLPSVLPAQYGEEKEDPLLVDFDAPWDDELIEKFATMPVQDGGRIKPFDTVARLALLKIHGKQTIKFNTKKGEKPTRRSATEWALYAMFAPESVKDLPLFIVDDSAAVVIIGFKPGQKRDRYSYSELSEHREEMMRKAREYSAEGIKNLAREEKMVVELANKALEFERIIEFLNFAKFGVLVDIPRDEEKTVLPEGVEAGENGSLPLSQFLKHKDKILELNLGRAARLREMWEGAFLKFYSGETKTEYLQKIGRARAIDVRIAYAQAEEAAKDERWKAVQEALRMIRGGSALITLFPPPQPEDAEENPVKYQIVLEGEKRVEDDWFSPADLIFLGYTYPKIQDFAIKRLALLESLVENVDDKEKFQADANKLFELIKTEGGIHYDQEKIEREVTYYQRDYFFYAQWLFLFAFLMVIISFMAPNRKISRILSGPVAVPLTIISLALLIWGIVDRCLIMGRPPVGTLYETILFITAVMVVVGLAVEFFNRRRIALLLSAFVGAGLLFVAYKFHDFQPKDTMDPLRAVLRTNFWLAVHVTTVCMGYSAGLLAAVIGNLYVILRLARFHERSNLCKELTRMSYGVVCFGMLFSLFGTVTGGIWANDSWGRFWGWDPKENGAFMIVLWNMVILHSRLGGYVKQIGIHVLAIIGGIIVAFSWWGVNELEIGLHSYGFTDGVWFWLTVFWGTQVGMLLIAAVVQILRRSLAPENPDNSPPSQISPPSKKVPA